MTARLTLAACAIALLAGCSQPSAPIPPARTAATPAVPTETIDHPEFANWSRFQPGTVVVRRSVAERDGRRTTSIETLKLVERTGEKLVVERQNTTERDDGYKKVNPADRRTIHRQFGVPAGMSADDFRKPALKATLAGEEAVTVLGKEYRAKVYKWTDGTEAGPMAVTVWQVDDLPGRIARQVMTVESLKTTTTEEVVELRLTP